MKITILLLQTCMWVPLFAQDHVNIESVPREMSPQTEEALRQLAASKEYKAMVEAVDKFKSDFKKQNDTIEAKVIEVAELDLIIKAKLEAVSKAQRELVPEAKPESKSK